MMKKYEEAEEFLNNLLGEDKMAEYHDTWCVITDGEMVHASEIMQSLHGADSEEYPFKMPNKGLQGTGVSGGAGVIIPSADCDYSILTCNMDLLYDVKAKIGNKYGYEDNLWVPCYHAVVQVDTADNRISKMEEESIAYKEQKRIKHILANEEEAEEFLTNLLGEDKIAEYKGTWCVITDGEMVHASEIMQSLHGADSEEYPFKMPNKGLQGTGVSGGAGVIAPRNDCDYTILTCNMDLLYDVKAKIGNKYGYEDNLWVPCYHAVIQVDTTDRRVAKMKTMTDVYEWNAKKHSKEKKAPARPFTKGKGLDLG